MKKIFFACLIFLAAGCGTLGGPEGTGTSGTGTGTTTGGGSVSGSGV